MKKLFYLLLLLPFGLFASCSDDDVADVDLNVTMSGVTQLNDSFYAVATDSISIDGVTATSLTDKAATVTNIRYQINGVPVFGTFENPYSITVPNELLTTGTNYINVYATVLQVDKSITSAGVQYPLVVVDSVASLPEGAPAVGTYTRTFNVSK